MELDPAALGRMPDEDRIESVTPGRKRKAALRSRWSLEEAIFDPSARPGNAAKARRQHLIQHTQPLERVDAEPGDKVS